MKKIFTFLDNDEAGEIATQDLINAFEGNQTTVGTMNIIYKNNLDIRNA